MTCEMFYVFNRPLTLRTNLTCLPDLPVVAVHVNSIFRDRRTLNSVRMPEFIRQAVARYSRGQRVGGAQV